MNPPEPLSFINRVQLVWETSIWIAFCSKKKKTVKEKKMAGEN